MIHGEGDQELLQRDLDTLYQWADENNKSFNEEKFEQMSFGIPSNRTYTTPSGNTIRKKEHIKDLGVYMSNDCSFDYHISNLVKGGTKVSAWILRTFLSREKFVMKILLQSLVVTKCEYASVVWSPFDNKNINRIENVQRRFTSKIKEYQTWDEDLETWICTVSYADRLRDLKDLQLRTEERTKHDPICLSRHYRSAEVSMV